MTTTALGPYKRRTTILLNRTRNYARGDPDDIMGKFSACPETKYGFFPKEKLGVIAKILRETLTN